jgi:hypothetical protein
LDWNSVNFEIMGADWYEAKVSPDLTQKYMIYWQQSTKEKIIG